MIFIWFIFNLLRLNNREIQNLGMNLIELVSFLFLEIKGNRNYGLYFDYSANANSVHCFINWWNFYGEETFVRHELNNAYACFQTPDMRSMIVARWIYSCSVHEFLIPQKSRLTRMNNKRSCNPLVHVQEDCSICFFLINFRSLITKQ